MDLEKLREEYQCAPTTYKRNSAAHRYITALETAFVRMRGERDGARDAIDANCAECKSKKWVNGGNTLICDLAADFPNEYPDGDDSVYPPCVFRAYRPDPK